VFADDHQGLVGGRATYSLSRTLHLQSWPSTGERNDRALNVVSICLIWVWATSMAAPGDVLIRFQLPA